MGSYRTYFIPSKTATLVPEFAMEDLPLSRTMVLVPEFAMKDLPLGRILFKSNKQDHYGQPFEIIVITKNTCIKIVSVIYTLYLSYSINLRRLLMAAMNQ